MFSFFIKYLMKFITTHPHIIEDKGCFLVILGNHSIYLLRPVLVEIFCFAKHIAPSIVVCVYSCVVKDTLFAVTYKLYM